MKAFSASLLTVLLALLPLTASPADSSKTLQNVKGSVTYGAGNPPSTKLAPKAQTALNDRDYAQTGPDSLATLTLPDSSQIEMASNANVRVDSFNQSDIAHAHFTVVGKMRFTVNHPSGAQADYHFSTPTGEIAVRGTVGDIFANPAGGLQVNVYALSTPSLPVQVTLVNGQVFTLAAGQSLVATAAAGAVTASVTAVSQSMFTPFSELGAPANASSMGITGASAGAGGAGGAAGGAGAGAAGGAGGAAAATTGAVVAGAAGAAAAVTTIASSNSAGSPSPSPSIGPTPQTSTTPSPSPTPTASPTPSPTPTASPTPVPSTTSVPITISGKSPAPKTPPPAPPVGPPPGTGPSGPHFPGVRPTPKAR